MANDPTVEVYVSLSKAEAHALRFARTSRGRVQAIVVPRHKIVEIGRYDDQKHLAVYFLFDDSRKHVYIGQATLPRRRIGHQYRKKHFWSTAVVAMSNTGQSFFKETLDWLEWQCATMANSVGRCAVKGKKYPHDPHTVAGGDEIFSDLSTILSVLGFPVFEPKMDYGTVAVSDDGRQRNVGTIESETLGGFYLQESAESLTFICEGDGGERGHAKATGRVVKDRATGTFVLSVCEGSTACLKTTATIPDGALRKRDDLIRNGFLEQQGGCFRFVREYRFTSPSRAASVVLGRSASGWDEWKAEHGEKLRTFKQGKTL